MAHFTKDEVVWQNLVDVSDIQMAVKKLKKQIGYTKTLIKVVYMMKSKVILVSINF